MGHMGNLKPHQGGQLDGALGDPEQIAKLFQGADNSGHVMGMWILWKYILQLSYSAEHV